MHILITDSGVGGVSVCAYAERFVRTHGFREPVRLTFANAAPDNDYGYNAMPSREVKIQTFDRFLRSVVERYRPDFVYVACNTLSVLLPDTPYVREAAVPVRGIVDTGVELLMGELAGRPEAAVMIFGTQTTIDAGAYVHMLAARGVDASRIIPQACPGLADTISEDREGARARAEIAKWVSAAIEKLPDPSVPVVACLACTHYGYRKQLFADALAGAGILAAIVDPNERAVDDLFGARDAGSYRDVEVEFVTRYPIPDATRQTLATFLCDVSPRAVAAVHNFIRREWF
jgi:glutamate racemase